MGKYKKNLDVMGTYNPSKLEQDAYSWCINNGIYISPKPSKSVNEWHVLIEINKKINVSPQVFQKIEIWKTLFKYYVYYFEKHKEKNKIT